MTEEQNRTTHLTRDAAWELLTRYNKDAFHLHHAETVEKTMRWFARELGYVEEEGYWGIVGLLHDIDFEQWPQELSRFYHNHHGQPDSAHSNSQRIFLMATLSRFAYVAFFGATLCGAVIAIWRCTDACLSGVHPQFIPFAAGPFWHL